MEGSSPQAARLGGLGDESRIIGNVLEVEQARRNLKEVPDGSNIALVDFEPRQGWLTGKIMASTLTNEPIPFLVELPPTYPSRDPPRFFFPKHQSNKTLENLVVAVNDFARLYQETKEDERRCLEDSLLFLAGALMNTPFTPHYGSASVAEFATGPTSSLILQAASGLPPNASLGTQLTSSSQHDILGAFSASVSKFPSQSASPVRAQLPHPSSSSLVAPLSLEDFSSTSHDSGIFNQNRRMPVVPSLASTSKGLMYPGMTSPSSALALDSNGTRMPPFGRHRRTGCGARFASNGLLVVFTTSNIQHSYDDSTSEEGDWANTPTDSSSEDAYPTSPILLSVFGSSNSNSIALSSKRVSTLSLLEVTEDVGQGRNLPLYNPYDNLNASRATNRLAKLAWELAECTVSNTLLEKSMKKVIQKLVQSREVPTLAALYARFRVRQQHVRVARSIVSIIPTHEVRQSYIRAYCDMLTRGRHFTHRCLFEKAVEGDQCLGLFKQVSERDTATFQVKRRLICSLCRLQCNSAVVICYACDHGGHVKCLENWFAEYGEEFCPAGCGCKCLNPLYANISGAPVNALGNNPSTLNGGISSSS